MKKVGLIGLVALVAIVGWWLWRGQHGKPIAAPSHAGSAVTSASVSRVPGTDRAAARVEVSVSDAKGPIANAVVRLVGDGGAIEVAKTNRDGVAHVAELAPGAWTISASAPGHVPVAAPERTLAAGETANVVLVLELGGRSLIGTVSDASGGPIAGARVDAAVLGGRAQRSDAVASMFTGSDGRYALTTGEGEVLVAVHHPDYSPQQRYTEVGAAGATVDFLLVPGGVIEGVVRDQRSHEVVPSAWVEAELDRGSTMLGEVSAHHIAAASDGHFRITGLRPGAYALSARAGDRRSTSPTVVGLGVAEQVTDVTILVGRGVTVRGLVVDEAGQPAPHVRLRSFGRQDLGAEVRSDDKGAFAIAGLAPGRYALAGESDDYVFASSPTPVELGTHDVDGVRVRVRRGMRVHGRVQPPQACAIRLASEAPMAGPALGGRAQADARPDGTFELGPIAPGSYTARARCPSGDEGAAKVEVQRGGGDLTIAVTRGASIAGRVVDAKGTPVAGASVNAGSGGRTEITNGMITSGAAAMTAADGTFELTGLDAATYQLSVLHRGRPLPMKSRDKATVAVAAGEHKAGVELVVDRPDGVIRGTVTGPDGKPLADAWVSVEQSFDDLLDGATTPGSSRMITVESDDSGDGGDAGMIAPVLTDAAGHFEITGLPRTPFTVVAEARAGALRGRVSKVTPDATITIPIASVRQLSGVVHVDAPPSFFSVELDGPSAAQRTFAWTDGSFAFARVDPGDYVVRVTSSAGTGEAKVTVGPDGGHVEITLTSNAVITGKLADKDGKAMPDLGVTAVPDTGDGQLQISLEGPPPTSGPDGTFHVETKPGKVVLVVLMPGAPALKRGLVAEAGQTLDIGTFVVAPRPPPKP